MELNLRFRFPGAQVKPCCLSFMKQSFRFETVASSTLGDLPSPLVFPGGFKSQGSDGSSSGQLPPDTAWRPSGPRAPAQEEVRVQQPVPAVRPLRPLPGQFPSWFCACRQGASLGSCPQALPGPSLSQLEQYSSGNRDAQMLH